MSSLPTANKPLPATLDGLGAWAAAPVGVPTGHVPTVFAELTAPADWSCIDLISDLHLTRASFDTTCAPLMQHLHNDSADALFILGDLFEAWIGDDAVAVDPFARCCADRLRSMGAAMPLFFMHGNRDFLVGRGLLDGCNVTLLDDPTVLDFDQRRWLLTHGDALCTDDHAYMAFRAQVRQPGFQQGFVSMPIARRVEVARKMRERSEAHQDSQHDIADVDADLAWRWLAAADAPVMIHGHTHRPDRHLSDRRAGSSPSLERWVMSDWDATAQPPRSQVLRLERGCSGQPRRIDLHGR